MDLNQRKNEIQDSAVATWKAAGCKGTCEIITGFGKTFLFLKALSTFPKYQNDTFHVFLAEQIDRKKDLDVDIKKFNEIFDRDILKEYNLQFNTYQSARNWSGYSLGLVCCDEVHEVMSRENCKFFLNNTYEAILGLTAKFDGSQSYNITSNNMLQKKFGKIIITKQELLNAFCPIVFSYNITQGQKEGTARKLNIFIIEHALNSVDKNVLAGSSSRPFWQSESANYFYLTTLYNNAINLVPKADEDLIKFTNRQNLAIMMAINKRKKFLHTLPSKRNICRELVNSLTGQTVLFGNELLELEKITPNVVSSKKTDEENNRIRDLFDEGVIKLIGSFKKLKQGANLSQLDNCIMHSYYGIELDFIQRVGRLRENSGKDGNVFIVVAKNTQEEVWLNAMLENSGGFNIQRMNIHKFMLDKHYESCNQ